MESPTKRLILLAALAACASQKKPKSLSPTPNWLTEECTKARAEVVRVIGETKGSGDEELQKVINEVKQKCGILQTETADILHVLLEDISEKRRRTATAPTPVTLPIPLPKTFKCEEMLDDFDKVPKICGVPDISVLIEKCGFTEEGLSYGIGRLRMGLAARMARWPLSYSDVKENGESIQAACEEFHGIRRQTITHLAYEGHDGTHWRWATPFFIQEGEPFIEKIVYYWNPRQGPTEISKTEIPCPLIEIQRLFRHRLCLPRRESK